MWPKATNVLEEFYYHWCRERRWVGGGGGGGGGGVVKGACAPHFFDWGGGQWYLCAPHF